MKSSFYKYFQGKEKWSLLLESFEYRISKRISSEVRKKRQILQKFLADRIPFRITSEGISFEYGINDKCLKFLLRNNSSDINVFSQIILDEEYKTVIDLVKRLRLQVNVIVDAGANVGFSSLYFFAYYTQAKFICLEPNSKTLKALSANISKNIPEKQFLLLQKALWNKQMTLCGDSNFRDGKDWSFHVKEPVDVIGDIEGITVNSLIHDYSLDEIDFLKIDIEGAEAQLFSNRQEIEKWIGKINIISMEIHDETDARFKIENMLQDFGFRIFHSGELTIAVNRKLVHLLSDNG